MGQKSVAVHRSYAHVESDDGSGGAAFDGLLGAHTTSVRQLDTGLLHPCIECIDNHELTELSNYRD
jgi:hypothetical protein